MTTSDSVAARPLSARGRPPVSVDIARARALIADGNSVRATAARLGVSEATLRTRLRDQKSSSEN